VKNTENRAPKKEDEKANVQAKNALSRNRKRLLAARSAMDKREQKPCLRKEKENRGGPK